MEYVCYIIQSSVNVISRFTAELLAEIDEIEALLAAPVATTTTQHKMVIIILYLHPCQFTTLWEYVYYVTQSGDNVISRFTAELGAEIDEIEALLDAPGRNNNNSAQNGTY